MIHKSALADKLHNQHDTTQQINETLPEELIDAEKKFDEICNKENEFTKEWKMYPKIVENYKVYYLNVEKIIETEYNHFNNMMQNENLEYFFNNTTRLVKACKNLKKVSERIANTKNAANIARELKL